MNPYISRHCKTPSPFGTADGKSWSKLFKTRIPDFSYLSFSCSISMEKSSKLMYKDLLDLFEVWLDPVGSLREPEVVVSPPPDIVLRVLLGVAESASLPSLELSRPD